MHFRPVCFFVRIKFLQSDKVRTNCNWPSMIIFQKAVSKSTMFGQKSCSRWLIYRFQLYLLRPHPCHLAPAICQPFSLAHDWSIKMAEQVHFNELLCQNQELLSKDGTTPKTWPTTSGLFNKTLKVWRKPMPLEATASVTSTATAAALVMRVTIILLEQVTHQTEE